MSEHVTIQVTAEALVERANAGDAAALAELVNRYQPLIRRWVRHFALDLADTGLGYDDLRQEAALAFVELVREYDPARGIYFGAYLKAKFGWRVGNCLSRQRRRRRGESTHEPETLDRLATRPEAAPPASGDQFQDPAKVTRPALRQALGRLTAIQREVLARVYGDGYQVDELAVHLDVSPKVVRLALRRARAQLRADLRPVRALAG